MKAPATSIRRPVGGMPKNSPAWLPVMRQSSAHAVLVDEQVLGREDEVGERGEPDAVDPLDLDAPFEDAAGRAHDDAVGRVVGGQRRARRARATPPRAG